MAGLIGVVSGLCTIAVTCLAVYAWLRNHAIIIRVHDATKLVQRDKLSILDIFKAMQRMTEDAKLYQPDYIIGINRGGAIVGGWLAKQLGHEAPVLFVVNSDQPPGHRVTTRQSDVTQLSGRVYLVDDAQRKGEHMREAVKYLKSIPSVSDIRRAVLLQMHIQHQGPEQHAFRFPPCDFIGFNTRDADVMLPWDL